MKQRVLTITSLTIAGLGMLFLAANFLNEQSLGNISVTLLVIPVYGAVVAALLARNRINSSLHSYINIGAVYVTGMLSAHFYGMIGPGMMFFLASGFMATILLSRRHAYVLIGLNLVTAAGYYYVWTTGFLTFGFDVAEYASSTETFISRVMMLAFFAGLLFINQHQIVDYLMGTLKEVGQTHRKLDDQYRETESARKKLELSEQKYRLLIDHTDDFIYSLTPEGDIISINPPMEKAMNLVETDIAGTSMFHYLPNKEHSLKLEKALSDIREGKPSSVYVVMTEQAGARHVTLTPVTDTDGTISLVTGRANDVTKLLEKEREIKRLAFSDPLTGLGNRTTMEYEVKQRLKRNEHFALLYFDLDRFKKVNDTLGHTAGDDLLKQIARRVETVLKKGAHAARVGGDEFAVIIEGNGLNEAETIRSILLEPVIVNDIAFYTGASIGLVCSPDHGTELEQLLQKADEAMYRSKAAGGGKVSVYDDSMREETMLLVKREHELRQALQRSELKLHYQPVIHAATGKVRGMEALLRWENELFPGTGPQEFIPILEANGLITEFGEWVLEHACVFAESCTTADWRPVVSVNVSPVQMKQPEFVETVRSILGRSCLAPEQLELEITEGTMMDTSSKTIQTLEQLRDARIRTALDDFGTGYSSLSYLRKLPIDTLKLDKSFLKEESTSRVGKHVTDAVISMAHALRLDVVAEGVETASQAADLQKRGCDFMQGYCFSEPLDSESFKTWVKLERSAADVLQKSSERGH
ncbi:putative bifunctional diguanylate cyclase/phosphodiesterase [Alkalicoccus luteus]|uniref:putative bifunctional diguanylate cyclase/phosphodiesterase n=1 Tax=Alkalicoccus luteus TaxID=1237094 RepID=UPI004033D3A6